MPGLRRPDILERIDPSMPWIPLKREPDFSSFGELAMHRSPSLIGGPLTLGRSHTLTSSRERARETDAGITRSTSKSFKTKENQGVASLMPPGRLRA